MGGVTLLHKYSDSPYAMLSQNFPEYEWLPWKFIHSPNNFWSVMKNQKLFLNWASTQLNIKEMEDWYKITADVIKITGYSHT